ncbi:MAG: hypothetical protein H6825_16940 [Planctomycetes bacterium]|nr:hypothetical protein [Planctomycetota bacterium]
MSHDSPTIPARDHKLLSFAVPCEDCGGWTERTIGPPGTRLPTQMTCAHCGVPQALDLPGHVDAEGRLDGCPRCDYHTLCIQKDVNGKLGVVLVLVTFGALLFSGLELPQMVAGLVLLALLDVVLLKLVVKRLLICYRCKAQYRGFPPGPRCRPFDLATWEAHDPTPDDAAR